MMAPTPNPSSLLSVPTIHSFVPTLNVAPFSEHVSHSFTSVSHTLQPLTGHSAGRQGGREGEREGERQAGREGGREGGSEGGREGVREGGREEGIGQ